MEKISGMFRVLAGVALFGVIIAFGYFAWELTKQSWFVGNLLLEVFSEEDLELRSMVAWFCIAALAAPWLALLAFLSMLISYMGGRNPTDPPSMRERAGALLREAEAIERWQANQRQDRLLR